MSTLKTTLPSIVHRNTEKELLSTNTNNYSFMVLHRKYTEFHTTKGLVT